MPERRAAKKPDDTHLVKPAAPDLAPVAGVARAVDPAAPQTASPQQMRRLNQRVGNRAVARLLTSGTVQAKLTVGPAGDRYEQEADRAADAVMRTTQAPAPTAEEDAPVQREMVEEDEPLQREMMEEEEPLQREPAAPAVGLDGGEAGGAIEAKLAANRGGGAPLPAATRAKMEAGLGADFSGVRVHTGSDAASLNQQLGAQAFTHGADVYMGAGKYAPGSSDGQHLLAHELTHVVQQGAGTVRRRAQRPAVNPLTETVADGVIHRKLSGTTEALEALGGEASLKSRGKAKLSALKSMVGMSTTAEGSGKYAQLLSRLRAYETLEAKLIGQNRNYLTGNEKAELFGELKEMELLVIAWLGDNADLAVSAETAAEKVRNLEPEQIKAGETEEQRRYHALKLLLPRLRHEQMEISRDDFYRTATWSDRRLNPAKTQDDAFGGAVNRLDKVAHGNETGVFTQDKTWADAMTVGSNLGIGLVDPNAGARSVAMYQLAKLLDLGVDVIAKTEFATHTSATNKKDSPLAAPMAKLGVRQALAPGQEAAETPTALTGAEARAQGGDTISLEDPTLQRSLNAIQLIDAIAGQIDRHWHNYYIATDGEGRVDGVVGIDLDMAFAPDHRTVAPATEGENDPLKGSHFVGLPRLVDSQFATRIVGVQPDAVAALLRTYLTEAEVAAAVERFRLVQEACRGILDRHEAILPGGWGAGTAQAQLADPTASYLGKMAAGVTKHAFVKPATAATQQQVKDADGRRGVYAIIETLEKLIWSNTLTALEGQGLVELIIANFNAAEEPEQRPLIQDLRTTPVWNWNNLLRRPPANPAVLLRTRPA